MRQKFFVPFFSFVFFSSQSSKKSSKKVESERTSSREKKRETKNARFCDEEEESPARGRRHGHQNDRGGLGDDGTKGGDEKAAEK